MVVTERLLPKLEKHKVSTKEKVCVVLLLDAGGLQVRGVWTVVEEATGDDGRCGRKQGIT